MTRSRITGPALGVLTTVAVLSSWLFSGTAAASVASPAGPAPDSVVVTGTGEVAAEPDTLTANFAAEATAATVQQALDRASTAATRMRDTLTGAGVADADLQTAGLSINPSRDENGKITGYTASQGLTAKIRDLPRAGTLISAAVTAGGDAARLNGVSFAVEKGTAELLGQARKKAFADAKEKAGLFAREAGRSLGRVVKVSEGTPGREEPFQKYAFADASVPVEPGLQRLTATVTVEWAFQPPPA